jgi:hypothetical protein
MVHDLLPLALRGDQRRSYCLLAIGMVARDVEEFTGRARHATLESVDEGGAHRAILKPKMASLSVALGSSVQRLEKCRMYSRRLFPGCCLQMRSSHYLPGRMYMPWKLSMKTRRRSVQSLILSCGKCSSHVHAESPR